jgi:transmembrane sensor
MDESQLKGGPVDEQAAYWLRVLKDEPTPERYEEFVRWRNASPQHALEFELAQQLDARLQRFYRTHGTGVRLLIQRARQQRSRRRRLAWAACALLAMVLPVSLLIVHDAAETYATTQAQQLIQLEDRSVVALNAHSEMRVSFSPRVRDLYLTRGQALFRVRHEASRPFRVHVGAAMVEAIGTQFDVRVDDDDREAVITVVEGAVKLAASPSRHRDYDETSRVADRSQLRAGELAVVRQDGRVVDIKQTDVMAVTAWRRRAEQLVFKNQSLEQIAEEFNRHNASPRLRIEGDALRNLSFHELGFNDARPDSLLRFLAQKYSLDIVREGDDITIRERER